MKVNFNQVAPDAVNFDPVTTLCSVHANIWFQMQLCLALLRISCQHTTWGLGRWHHRRDQRQGGRCPYGGVWTALLTSDKEVDTIMGPEVVGIVLLAGRVLPVPILRPSFLVVLASPPAPPPPLLLLLRHHLEFADHHCVHSIGDPTPVPSDGERAIGASCKRKQGQRQ